VTVSNFIYTDNLTRMVDNKHIDSIRVVGMQKKKEHGSSKHYEFILRVKWSTKVEMTVYRPYSMFFDFQGVLCEMFKEKYSISIPPVPATKFHWMLLGKLGIEKECRAMEEFCQKILSLPPMVSQSIVVLHFFDSWGTDIRTYNQQSTEVVGVHGLGSPVIHSQESATNAQDSIPTSLPSENDHQYRAIASFKATNPGEISFSEDNILTVIEKTERGWWFVCTNEDSQGWAPATYLEPMATQDEEGGGEWVTMDESDSHAHIYSTVVSYTAENPDEVSYDCGEDVEVIAKSNYGWWKIRYKDQEGLTPASNLRRKGEEYSSPAGVGKSMSISSENGLYAVVRKAPPRTDSIRRSGNFSGKVPSRFVYSTASFSGGKFSFDGNETTPFQEKASKDKKNADREPNPSAPAKMSYENIGMEKKTKVPNQEEQTKGIKIQGVEFYSAIADYKPARKSSGHLMFETGDLMQLISVDEGWFFVHLHRGGEVLEGWIPSTYVERKWDVDLSQLNISKPQPAATASPKPKPKPRPRPRDKPEDTTPSPPTPPVPQPRGPLPNISNEADPRNGHSNEKHERPRLPLPAQPPTQNKSEGKQNTRSPEPVGISASKDQEDMVDSIYDEPEAQLRSVYDAEPWFFGKLSRQKCEQMLNKNGRQQEFLVRESTRGSGSYALSVKYCYRIRHFPIETVGDGKLLIGKLTFLNLIDIVSYYKENPLFYSEHKEPITLGEAFHASV